MKQQIPTSSWWVAANGASSSSTKVTIRVERFFRPTNAHLRGHWLPLPSLCRSQSYAIQCPRVNLFPSASTCGRPQEELYWLCYFRHYTVNLGIFLRLSWLLSALNSVLPACAEIAYRVLQRWEHNSAWGGFHLGSW